MTKLNLSNNYADNNPAIPLKFASGNETTGYVQSVAVESISGAGGDPLASYKISDLDEATSTKYYGNVDADGAWYILKLTSTAARYIMGTSSYTTNWTNRASLAYDYFDVVF